MEKMKLKAVRANRDLTIKQVSEAVGISERSISQWEQGKQLPSMKLLMKLLEFYQVKLEDIQL